MGLVYPKEGRITLENQPITGLAAHKLAKLGIDALPQSLSDSLRVMERSELVQEALGEHIFEWFLRNKRTEWRGYKTHVSQYELDRYLRAL